MAGEQQVPLRGWRVWQSRDGTADGWWYATRTTPPPRDPPVGWAVTVYGRTAGDVGREIAAQMALERGQARREALAARIAVRRDGDRF